MDTLAEYQLCNANVGSFDPNEKEVIVGGQTNAPTVLPGEKFEYQIHFQNTGTDTAFRVVVEDRLPPELDPTSVQPVASSHLFTFNVRENGTLHFVFDPIALVDSHMNVAASQGFVKFRISQKPGLAKGTAIHNFADIFFDFNEPVRTNTTTVLVQNPPVFHDVQLVAISPNPADDFAQVFFQKTGPAAELRLFRSDGQFVGQFSKKEGEKFVRLDLSRCPTGLCFLQILQGGRVASARVVKQ